MFFKINKYRCLVLLRRIDVLSKSIPAKIPKKELERFCKESLSMPYSYSLKSGLNFCDVHLSIRQVGEMNFNCYQRIMNGSRGVLSNIHMRI